MWHEPKMAQFEYVFINVFTFVGFSCRYIVMEEQEAIRVNLSRVHDHMVPI